MLPQVVNQQFVQPFKFWNGGVQTGMRYQAELYAHVRSYKVDERLQAYELACELADKGIQTVVSCSQACYMIWASLRSPLQSTSTMNESVALADSLQPSN